MTSSHSEHGDDHDGQDDERHDEGLYEMTDSLTLPAPSTKASSSHSVKPWRSRFGLRTRYALGLLLLLCVVFLWTASNFLGSSIFANQSYAKPFFLTYLNTSSFVVCLLPVVVRGVRNRDGSTSIRKSLTDFWRGEYPKQGGNYEEEEVAFLKPAGTDSRSSRHQLDDTLNGSRLGAIATARLSLVFCLLWFFANYFAMSCLQYTTVASTTILTSTSSVWTLLVGAITRTEKFTWRKLCGILASLAGIALISQLDLNSDGQDGQPASTLRSRQINEFPEKSSYELALGDGMALLSAIIYGFYTITLKKVSVSALPQEIHMPTFFGFVGLFNMVLLSPLFLILHYTGIETFQFPPDSHVWIVLLVNSMSSLLSDICWAYAMVFTSPLVVTLGLSLTIPLSLVGEILIQGKFESWLYWVGAAVVVGSFVFVEREEKEDTTAEHRSGQADETDSTGEPGPAIVVEDWDEMLTARSQEDIRV